jgi:hypothetical protein
MLERKFTSASGAAGSMSAPSALPLRSVVAVASCWIWIEYVPATAPGRALAVKGAFPSLGVRQSDDSTALRQRAERARQVLQTGPQVFPGIALLLDVLLALVEPRDRLLLQLQELGNDVFGVQAGSQAIEGNTHRLHLPSVPGPSAFPDSLRSLLLGELLEELLEATGWDLPDHFLRLPIDQLDDPIPDTGPHVIAQIHVPRHLAYQLRIQREIHAVRRKEIAPFLTLSGPSCSRAARLHRFDRLEWGRLLNCARLVRTDWWYRKDRWVHRAPSRRLIGVPSAHPVKDDRQNWRGT